MSARPIAFRAGQGRPCPACGSESKGCSATDDGLHLCRGEQQSGWKAVNRGPDQAGFHHLRREGESTAIARPAPSQRTAAEPTATDWKRRAERFASQLREEDRTELATRLGLPEDSVLFYPLLGSPGRRSKNAAGFQVIFSIPEFNAREEVVGITERYPASGQETKEQQKMITGGHRGLMLPCGWREQPGPVFVVEGASDAIAARAAGLAAVGRPGADGGAFMLADLLSEWPSDRDIVVVAEREASGAGKKGADKLARVLAKALNRVVLVGYPPDEAKDTRAWLTAAERGSMTWPERGAAFSLRTRGHAAPITRFRRCPECRANITTVERVVSWRPAAVGSLSSPVDTGNTLEEAAVSATFQAGGQTWPVRLTVGTIGRLRSEVGFEVTQRAIETTDFVQTLFFDPMRFAEVLWVAVSDEAKGRGITKDAFFDTLGGEELQEAGNVFASAVVDHLFGSRAAPAPRPSPRSAGWSHRSCAGSRPQRRPAAAQDSLTLARSASNPEPR